MSDMYTYDYRDEEKNESREAGEVLQEGSEEYGRGREPKQKKTHPMAKKVTRRVASLVLSGVIFGAAAAGVFVGIDSLRTDDDDAVQETAAAEGDTITTTEQNLFRTSSGSEERTGSLDVSDIAEAALPSIVAITSSTVQEVQSFFGMFEGGEQSQVVESCGSGIIIGENDTELLIVTNYHVIEDADTLSVCFVDDQAYEAVIKGREASKDLAVVAVTLDDISEETMNAISIATIGDSDSLKVGEQVVAIGNALGYGQSVTTGIVSAKDCRLESEEGDTIDYDDIDLIQTDAAINPGNSGGALLNMNGEVVGINSAKIASSDVEGMGYAISISEVYDTIEDLMNEETRTKVEDENRQATLGISGASVSEEASQTYGIPLGVFVSEVTEGGAAQDAGITANSIITAFDGKTVTDINELKDLLTYYEAGETVEVTLQVPGSDGYTEETVTVVLGGSVSTLETETQEQPTEDFSQDRGGVYSRFSSSQRENAF